MPAHRVGRVGEHLPGHPGCRRDHAAAADGGRAEPGGRRHHVPGGDGGSPEGDPGRPGPAPLAEPRGVDRLRDRGRAAPGGQRRGRHRRADRAVRTGRAAGRHRSAVAARHRRGAEPRPSGPGPDGRARPRPGRRRPAVRPRRRCGPGLRGRRGHHPGRRGHVGARHDHGPPGHDPVQPGPGQRDGTALRRRGAAGPGRGGRGTRLAAPGRGVLAVLARARLLDRGRVHRRVLRLRHRGPHAAHRHGGDLRVREPGDRGPARRAHPERAADPGHVRRRGADRRGGGARRAPQPASTPNNRATATRGGHTCTGWTEWQSRVMPC